MVIRFNQETPLSTCQGTHQINFLHFHVFGLFRFFVVLVVNKVFQKMNKTRGYLKRSITSSKLGQAVNLLVFLLLIHWFRNSIHLDNDSVQLKIKRYIWQLTILFRILNIMFSRTDRIKRV